MSSWLLAVVVVLSAFRLTRLVTVDFVTDPFRAWVARRWGEDSKLTYLVECPWCLSIWLAPFPVVAAVLWPTNRVVLIVLGVLAASAITGLLANTLDAEAIEERDE